MTGVTELFRASITDEVSDVALSAAVSLAWAVAALVAALFIHRRYNRVFSDLL